MFFNQPMGPPDEFSDQNRFQQALAGVQGLGGSALAGLQNMGGNILSGAQQVGNAMSAMPPGALGHIGRMLEAGNRGQPLPQLDMRPQMQMHSFKQNQEILKEEREMRKEAREAETLRVNNNRTTASQLYKTLHAQFMKDGKIEPHEQVYLDRALHGMANPADFDMEFFDSAMDAFQEPGEGIDPTSFRQNWDLITELGGPGWKPGDPYNEGQKQALGLKAVGHVAYDERAQLDKADSDTTIDFYKGYGAQKGVVSDAVKRLKNVRAQLKLGKTGPGGEYLSTFSPRLQALQAAVNEIGLEKIGKLNDMGVRLTPITEVELEILLGLSARITNFPEANDAIMQEAIYRAELIEHDLEATNAFIRNGGKPVSGGASLAEYIERSREARGLDEPPVPNWAQEKSVASPPPPGTSVRRGRSGRNKQAKPQPWERDYE